MHVGVYCVCVVDHISRMQHCILVDMCLCAEGAISVFSCVCVSYVLSSSYFIKDIMTYLIVLMCMLVCMCRYAHVWMWIDISILYL